MTKPKRRTMEPICTCGRKVHTSDCALFKPDWTRKCENCGQAPIVPLTGMCGPCTWGEAETVAGNW